MWLLRGLSFTCKALQNSQANKAQELSAAFNSSYDATLKKFHSIFIRPVFTVSSIAPIRFFFFPPVIIDTLKWGSGRERGNEGRSLFTLVDLQQPFSPGSIPVVACRVDVADVVPSNFI